nr:6458_t:CDS:2 [Entrophospora candida]
MLIFLPNIATNFIQHSYYSFAYRVASDVPKPGQPKHILHRKRIYIFVVTTYLIYTIIDVINSIPANFYDIHLLRHDFTEPELRSSFRKLQLLFHPDKNRDDKTEEVYIKIRTINEILSSPITRFAYDRFGSDIFNTCDHCRTYREFVFQGLRESIEFYIGTGLLLFVLNVLGKGQFGRFWRFAVFFGMAFMEASMILHNPVNSIKTISLRELLMSRWLIFEQITILRQLFVTIFIGLSQIGPVMFPEEAEITQTLQKIDVLSELALQESKNQLNSAFQPFIGDQDAQNELKRSTRDVMIDDDGGAVGSSW